MEGRDKNLTYDPYLRPMLLARAYAIQLREFHGFNAVPIVNSWMPTTFDQPATRADVVQLVINSLPVPGETHAIEDVLAFRDEMRSQGVVQGLRVWMNQMTSGDLGHGEIEDQLEYLISQFDRALQLERMQRDAGVFETLIRTTAEIAESLVKFQWSKLAKGLFSVRHKQIDLMKAEMTLPGREVAYIVKARERFGS